MKRTAVAFFVFTQLLLVVPVAAQTDSADSLTIDQAVRMTVENHPLVQRALQSISASEAQVGVARSPLYPDISGTATYSRIGPVPQFDLPVQGAVELAPYNNYDLHLGLRQTLYDFNRTATAVEFARANLRTVSDSLEYVKWNLAYQTTATYNLILILHQSISVLDEQIDALDQHLAISQKRVETGTATKLDVLTTQVRVASASSTRIDIANALRTQEILLRQLLGMPPEKPLLLSGQFSMAPVSLAADSLLQAAMSQRPEIRTAQDAETTAVIQTRVAALGDKPTLSLGLLTGLKNGYEPNLNRITGNFVASLSIQAPIFNGYRTRYLKELAQASLLALQYRNTDLKRRITTEVEQAISNAQASLEKISNTQVQVSRAEEALTIAKAQYGAGVITNLDLLDAQTSLSEAKLVYLRAKYDYINCLNTLDRVTGKKIW